MFKTLAGRYTLTIAMVLLLLAIFWLLVSGLVSSMQIIFPVFIAPVFLGIILGILVPIISSRSQEKDDKPSQNAKIDRISYLAYLSRFIGERIKVEGEEKCMYP